MNSRAESSVLQPARGGWHPVAGFLIGCAVLLGATSAIGDTGAVPAPRYVNNGNGTVTDNQTRLVWLKNPGCFSFMLWDDAKLATANLKSGDCSLTDGSKAGSWRQATASEWAATIADAVALGCPPNPSLTNDPGTGCLSAGPTSFSGVLANIYWTSTFQGVNPNDSFSFLNLGTGTFGSVPRSQLASMLVWPVRDETCTLDADGNGTIDALTDGLILLRAMFGLTGTSVTNGAIGGGTPTRTTWAEIRPYLNASCGTNFAQ